MTTEYYLDSRRIAIRGSLGVIWGVDPDGLPAEGKYSACSGGYQPKFASLESLKYEMDGKTLHLVECWMKADDLSFILEEVGELRFFTWLGEVSTRSIRFKEEDSEWFGFRISVQLWRKLSPELKAKIITLEQYFQEVRNA